MKSFINFISLYKKHFNSVFLLISLGVHCFFNWLTIININRIYGTDMVGIYSHIIAICLPILTFFDFSMKSMQITDTRDDKSESVSYEESKSKNNTWKT